MWATMSRDHGHRLMHLLIRYLVDRRDNENRWVQALETTDVPLNFVWGMRDPISGAHMAERAFASVCLTLLSRPSMTWGTGHRSRHPSARPRLSARTETPTTPIAGAYRPRHPVMPLSAVRCPRAVTRGETYAEAMWERYSWFASAVFAVCARGRRRLLPVGWQLPRGADP